MSKEKMSGKLTAVKCPSTNYENETWNDCDGVEARYYFLSSPIPSSCIETMKDSEKRTLYVMAFYHEFSSPCTRYTIYSEEQPQSKTPTGDTYLTCKITVKRSKNKLKLISID